MTKNPFTEAVEGVLKLALERCAANPQCEQFQMQVHDLRNCLAREDKAVLEMKAKADFAAGIVKRTKRDGDALRAKIAAHQKQQAEEEAAAQARAKKADDGLKAKVAAHEKALADEAAAALAAEPPATPDAGKPTEPPAAPASKS